MLNLTTTLQHKNKTKHKKEILWWFFIISLFSFEYLVFRSYVLQEISPYYPANSDQSSYLMTLYPIYQNILNPNLSIINKAILIFKEIFLNLANSLFYLQGLIAFLFLGASRLSALTLNFTYFLILQLATTQLVKKLSHCKACGCVFLGLLLAIETPFFGTGDLVDFRLDFVTFCMYGLLITSIINSQIFLNRKWSIIAALIAIITIATREITFVYIILITLCLLFYFLLYKKLSCENEKINANKSIRNIIIFASVFLTITLCILFLHRDHIYNYYIVGHITGIEKNIRANTAGITDKLSSLTYYFPYICKHIGYWASMILFLISAFILYVFLKKNVKKKHIPNFKTGLFFLSSCAIIPLAILIMDMQKSYVVIGIIISPILWLFMWFFIYSLQKYDNKKTKQHILWILAIISMTIGILHYLHEYKQHSPFYYEHDNELTKMYEDIGNYTNMLNLRKINLAVDQINDYLNNGTLVVLYYEKYGILLDVDLTLGNSIFTINAKRAITSLRNSDVFIATLHQDSNPNSYPFNNDMRKLRPLLNKQVKKLFIIFNVYHFKGNTYKVYVKKYLFKHHGLMMQPLQKQ